MKTRYQYIHFERAPFRWDVRNNRSGGVLGEIRWYGPWRQYCFFPIVSAGCLADIKEFIEQIRREG